MNRREEINPSDAFDVRRFVATPGFESGAALVLLVIAVANCAFLLSAAWPFNTDDAYITLRYSQHLAAGLGPLWNIGEPPVEGYSNFLFVVLGALAIHAGLDPLLTLKAASVACLIVSLFLLYFFSSQWVRPLLATLPSILLSAYYGTAWWTVSGLETAVYQCLVLLAVFVFVMAVRARTGTSFASTEGWSKLGLALAGFLVFLAAITRVEGPIVGIALGLALLFHLGNGAQVADFNLGGGAKVVRAIKLILPLAAGFVVPYAVYFFWRQDYYGRLLPNPVYCKSGFAEDPWFLVRSYVALAWPLFLIGGVALWKRFDFRTLLLTLLVLLYVMILYNVDPIIGHYNRHFLVVLALHLVMGAIGFSVLLEAVHLPALRTWFSALLAFSLLAVVLLRSPGQATALGENAGLYANRMALRAELAGWLNHRLDPEDSFIIGDAGIVPYLVQARVMDAYCLNSPEMTSIEVGKSEPVWADTMMQRRPRMVVLHSRHINRMEPRAGVFSALFKHPILKKEYGLVAKFGVGSFNYWVYQRLASEAAE